MIPLFKVYVNVEPAVEELRKVLASGYIGQGPKVDEFERELKKLLNSRTTPVSLNSCTSAIELALHLCNVKDKWVITTPQTCTATNTAILARGGKIYWADVDMFTGNIDPGSIAKAVETLGKDNVAAIVCVDWGGSPCEYNSIRRACGKIPVIEDAAHSLLTNYLGQSIARNGGDFVCYSFQAIKHLTTGDGGALICPDEETTRRAELLRWYGLDRKSSANFRCAQNIQEAGYKFQMNDIAATIGLANIKDMQIVVANASSNACSLSGMIESGKGIIYTPLWDAESSYWLYTILVRDRDQFMEFMKEKGIDTSPVHARNDKHNCFPPRHEDPYLRIGLDYFSKHQVSIPNGWWLKPEDLEYIANCCNEWNNKY